MPSLSTPGGVGVPPSENRITARRDAPAAQVERLDDHLRVADARRRRARPRSGARGTRARRPRRVSLPLELDAELVERGLEHGLRAPRGRPPARASGPALTAAPSTSRSSSASIGLATTHSPASSWRPENTDTNTIGVLRQLAGRRGSARSTSKPSMPGHQDVERDRVEAARCAAARAPPRRSSAIVAVDVERRELAGDQLGDLGLVVDDEHAAAADRLERRGRRRAPGTAAGSRTRKVVPRPGSLSTLDLRRRAGRRAT